MEQYLDTEPMKILDMAVLFCLIITNTTGLTFSTYLQIAPPMLLLPSGSECSMVATTSAPADEALGTNVVCITFSEDLTCSKTRHN